MTELDDEQLLARYAAGESDAAFTTLVARHINLVYSAAWRFTGNPDHAREITQAVFIVLARKAGRLPRGTLLSGWLYQTARLTAANFVKREVRRHRREQEAYMQSSLTGAEPDSGGWHQIAPLLEEALGRLGDLDRNAIVLRYLENKTTPEVASALRVTEAAANKRVSRALEKMRGFLVKRGVTLSLAGLAAALAANGVQAAPAGLAAATVAAVGGAASAASAASLADGTLRVMTWLKVKFAAGVCLAALAAAGPVAATFWRHAASVPDAGALPTVARDQDAAPQAGGARGVQPEASKRGPPDSLPEGAVMSLDTPPGGLALQPDGKILLGASLCGCYIDPRSGRLGQFQRGAFRLNPDGSWDSGFGSRVDRPASDAHRAYVAALADGRVFMSGLFDAVDGQGRPGYAMLRADGRVEESFVPFQGTTNPARTYLPGGTYPAAALSDGSGAVMSGAVEGRMAPYPLTAYRLAASGEWIRPARNKAAPSLFPRPSGLILTLGPLGFWTRKPIAWGRATPAKRHALHFAPGMEPPVADIPFDAFDEPPSGVDVPPVLAALFDEVPIELCRYAARSPDGGTVLAMRSRVVDGSMIGYGGFMRFDKDWRPDLNFTNRYEADIRSPLTLKRQADGKLLVAGVVGRMNGEAFPGLARLSPDGSLDPSFRCKTGRALEDRVMDFAVQPDGRILICGFFTSVNGVKCQHLARLQPDGSLDTTFQNPFVSLETLNAVRFPVHHLDEAEAPETGTAAAGNQAAASAPETIVITSMSFQNGVASVGFAGTPNQSYVLQAKDSVGDVNWKTVSTNQADANGAGFFRDADAKDHPMRFYRVATRSSP